MKGFLDAVTIWINKPHVVNRRLCGTKIKQITTAESQDTVERIVSNIVTGHNDCSETKGSDNTHNLEVDLKETDAKFVVIIREMLPKNSKIFPTLLEAVVFGKLAL